MKKLLCILPLLALGLVSCSTLGLGGTGTGTTSLDNIGVPLAVTQAQTFQQVLGTLAAVPGLDPREAAGAQALASLLGSKVAAANAATPPASTITVSMNDVIQIGLNIGIQALINKLQSQAVASAASSAASASNTAAAVSAKSLVQPTVPSVTAAPVSSAGGLYAVINGQIVPVAISVAPAK